MRKASLIVMLSIVILSCAFLGTYLNRQVKSDRIVEYDYEADIAALAGYDTVLRFAGGSDFSPFTYLDENGQPCGRDVELAVALGRELGCRVEVTLGDWTEMQAGLLDGTYDVLMTVDYSEERGQIMGYTSPVCLDSYVFFGMDPSLDLSDLNSVSALHIAALDGGGATENYLIPMKLMDNATFYDTQAAAFQSVKAGENDVAIAGYIYGSNIISSLDLDLTQVGTPLYGAAYYFTYDIADDDLGHRLNDSLAALEADGTLESIEEKWTTHYQPSLTLLGYVTQNRQTVLLVSLGVLLGLMVLAELLTLGGRRREKTLLERDQLTGLYHTRQFLERAAGWVQRHHGREYVLVRFDLDNFKEYNTNQGIEKGDQLLKHIGRELSELQSNHPGMVLSGYLGADHFALLARRDSVEPNMKSLYKTLNTLVSTAQKNFRFSIRIGVCPVSENGARISQDCDRALLALRSVKNNYYQHYAFFDDTMRSRLAEEKKITDRMLQALEDERFEPYFQPQYDYATGKICGAEALARWIDPELGVISPGSFVPVFEQNGVIYELDKIIWKATARRIVEWKLKSLNPPPVSVNISRADIYHSDLIETLQSIVTECGLTLADLHLEITESAYLDNSTLLMDTVKQLRQLGAHVEMDDFGSGYSSLAVLKEMDFDIIKLDMSLIQNNSMSGKDAALLSAIVQLSRTLGLSLIAEGVENQQLADYLHQLGCDKMQGFLFSPPVPAEEFELLLRKELPPEVPHWMK